MDHTGRCLQGHLTRAQGSDLFQEGEDGPARDEMGQTDGCFERHCNKTSGFSISFKRYSHTGGCCQRVVFTARLELKLPGSLRIDSLQAAAQIAAATAIAAAVAVAATAQSVAAASHGAGIRVSQEAAPPSPQRPTRPTEARQRQKQHVSKTFGEICVKRLASGV